MSDTHGSAVDHAAEFANAAKQASGDMLARIEYRRRQGLEALLDAACWIVSADALDKKCPTCRAEPESECYRVAYDVDPPCRVPTTPHQSRRHMIAFEALAGAACATMTPRGDVVLSPSDDSEPYVRVTNPDRFNIGDRVLNVRTGEQFRVDAPSSTETGLLSVTRGSLVTGSTPTAMLAGDELYIIGGARPGEPGSDEA